MPETHYSEEPPVGFQVAYYDADGLRSAPVMLAINASGPPEEVKSKLYAAYLSLCQGLRARPSVKQAVRRAIGGDDGA